MEVWRDGGMDGGMEGWMDEREGQICTDSMWGRWMLSALQDDGERKG